MRHIVRSPLFSGVLICSLFVASHALANVGVGGRVYCDVNDNGQTDLSTDIPLDGVDVDVVGDLGFTNSATTGSIGIPGYYTMELSFELPQTYVLSVDESSIPDGGVVIQPLGGEYTFTAVAIGDRFDRDFLVDSSACAEAPQRACWLTAGGVKFSQITGGSVAEHGPRNSFGGNVFPSCDPDPGNGGQWNHVDHASKLHFQGFDIETVDCGNVPGIEPGSESPVTGVNYIEFAGTGRLQGIKGNKVDVETVYFFARAEDRNEPGNERASAGEDIDRYFLHVFSDPGNPLGSTLLLVDEDGVAETVAEATVP
jgi:hypothetical protein